MIYHMVKTNQYSFMIMDIIIYKSTNTLSWKLENCLLFWSIGYNFIVKHSNSEKIMRHLTKIVFLLQAALYVCLWWVLFNAHISACLKPLVSWSRKLFLITSADEVEGGYVFSPVCLFVCLSVCLFVCLLV